MPPRRPSLVYVGIRGHVVAINRLTGAEVWKTGLKGSQFVQVTRDQDFVFATAKGELFCLSPLSGEVIWHNSLKGMGWDLGSIASDAPLGPSTEAAIPAKSAERQRQAAAASA
jgi:outer membrane protein assembly factor BamB